MMEEYSFKLKAKVAWALLDTSFLEITVSATQDSSSVVNWITHLDQLEKGVEHLNLSPELHNVPKQRYSLRALQ